MNDAETLAQARAAQQRGDVQGAIAAYRAVPTTGECAWDAAFELGVLYQSLGDTPSAIEAYTSASSIDPKRHEAYLNLGVCRFAMGEIEPAVSSLAAAAERSGDDVTPHINLGRILLGQHRPKDALPWLETAATRAPSSADAHLFLGLTQRALEQYSKAAETLARARDETPNSGEIRYELARALYQAGRYAEASDEIREAERLAPDTRAIAHLKLLLAQQQRDRGAATAAASEILSLGEPDAKTARLILSTSRDGEIRTKTLNALNHVVRTRPRDPGAWKVLAEDAYTQGNYDRASEILEEGVAVTGDGALRFIAALNLPIVALSTEEIDRSRATMNRHLDHLLGERPFVDNPMKAVERTPFLLAYQGRNDRALQKKIAQAFLAICPGLAWTAPHCARQSRRKRIRIGFLSTMLRNHSVGWLIARLIRGLGRAGFEVCVIRATERSDDFGEAIDRSVDKVIVISPFLAKARQEIADLELDILFHTEIGMDVFTYFLAFSRLAPVQVVWPGHPVTTGIPAIDLFISTSLMEPANAQEHYSERLFLLNGLPGSEQSRQWMIPERGEVVPLPAGPLYLCPMSIYKYHPDFDSLIEMIMRRDPKGKVVLIGFSTPWEIKRNERLVKAAPNAFNRVVLIHSQPRSRFLALLEHCDVILDTWHFGGGNTTRDAFAVHSPVVTLPGEFLRGRTTAGLYTKMGLNHLISASPEAYADLAVALANDAALRHKVSKEISEARPALFDDDSVIPQYRDLFMGLAGR